MSDHPRILLIYHRNPTTTAAYLEAALRRQADVLTAGAGQEVELPRQEEVSLPRLLERLGREFELVLEVEGDNVHTTGHQELGVSCAWWAIDSHLHMSYDQHFFRARGFDHVFVAQKHHVIRYREWAWVEASWLPLAADPSVFRPIDETPRAFQVGFVGNVIPGLHDARLALLRRLYGKVDRLLLTRGVWREDVARELARCQLVFNRSLHEDVNMRVFEALACGRPLLTDRLDGKCGLEELFVPEEHLFLYDEETLEDRVDELLRNEQETERVAKAGRERLLAAHTYDHRAEEILRVFGLSSAGSVSGRSASEDPSVRSAERETVRA